MVEKLKTLDCDRGSHEWCRGCSCTCHKLRLAPKRGQKLVPTPNFEDALHANKASLPKSSSGVENRPSRHRTLLDVARVLSYRGTCSRAQVGAVIARDGRIIGTGYNGAPAGMPHCIHESWRIGEPVPDWMILMRNSADSPVWEPDHQATYYLNGRSITAVTQGQEAPGCDIAEHAERNAIAYAARYGLSTDQSTLYSTHEPCLDCSRAIINAGIIRVFYETPYRKHDGIALLTQAGVDVYQLDDLREMEQQ